MSIQDWGAIGEIAGAIGVLITLIYLARQVRHSTDVAKVTSYHDAIHQMLESSKDRDFAIFLHKIEVGEELTDEELSRAKVLSTIFIYAHEILLHLHEKGQVDDELWENLIENNLPFLRTKMLYSTLTERTGPISKRLLTYIQDRGNAA